MAYQDFGVNDIAVRTFTVSTLGTAQFVSPLNGFISYGTPAIFARVEYSWTGVTGGDGTSALRVAGHVITSNAPVTPANGAAQIPITSRIGSTVAAYSTSFSASLGLTAAAPANGSEYCDFICQISTNTGPVCPFPRYWSIRLSNAGTAYTGGTLSIDRVMIFG